MLDLFHVLHLIFVVMALRSTQTIAILYCNFVRVTALQRSLDSCNQDLRNLASFRRRERSGYTLDLGMVLFTYPKRFDIIKSNVVKCIVPRIGLSIVHFCSVFHQYILLMIFLFSFLFCFSWLSLFKISSIPVYVLHEGVLLYGGRGSKSRALSTSRQNRNGELYFVYRTTNICPVYSAVLHMKHLLSNAFTFPFRTIAMPSRWRIFTRDAVIYFLLLKM